MGAESCNCLGGEETREGVGNIEGGHMGARKWETDGDGGGIKGA
jgi:hypothetical protein